MISANNITKKFGKFTAVDNVSFEVEKGEIVGFLGSNAAGKTTTMRILTCYFPPTSGEAKVAGFDVFNDSLNVRKNVGYLPENVPLYTDMHVEQFLDFAAALKGIGAKERDAKVDAAIDKCGLEDVRYSEIGHLSKGYRQRVGIAQAIINDPPVLILDEPTVGLDPKQIIDIRNLIKSFGGKSTVILSTHILHEIEMVCDRVLIIDRGKILEHDTIENLASKYSQTENICLAVDGSTEKVKSILREIPDIKKVEDIGKLSSSIYKYRISVPRDLEIRRHIFDKFTSADYKILEMATERMTAEEIFRRVVPDRVKDENKDKEKKTEKSKSKKKAVKENSKKGGEKK